MTREKVIRDIVRLEIAALLNLSAIEKSCFMQDVMQRAKTHEERGWIRDELRKIESMLRVKVEAHDEV